MKFSEMIRTLNSFKTRLGDVPVYLSSDAEENVELTLKD